MPRLTADQWLEARRTWESDPTATFESLSAKLGISRQAVGKMADKQGWMKPDALAQINRAAQARADAAEVADQVADETVKKPLPASAELSTDLRAKLVQAHRAELRKHAQLFPAETVAKDFEAGKRHKIMIEAIAIRQKAERAAWGMDDSTAQPTIVIERSFGK